MLKCNYMVATPFTNVLHLSTDLLILLQLRSGMRGMTDTYFTTITIPVLLFFFKKKKYKTHDTYKRPLFDNSQFFCIKKKSFTNSDFVKDISL